MTPDLLFSICSALVVVPWLLLAVAPRWIWTARIVLSGIVPLLLGVVYAVLILRWIGTTNGGFGSLSGVFALFQNPWLLLAGWIHYLAFDLVIGCWEVSDALRHRVPHLLVVPCLVLTFLFGPIGLVVYWLIRASLRGRLPLMAQAAS